MQRCRRSLRLATGVLPLLPAPTTRAASHQREAGIQRSEAESAIRPASHEGGTPLGGNDGGASRKGGPRRVAALESAYSSGSTVRVV